MIRILMISRRMLEKEFKLSIRKLAIYNQILITMNKKLIKLNKFYQKEMAKIKIRDKLIPTSKKQMCPDMI